MKKIISPETGILQYLSILTLINFILVTIQ